MKKALSLHSLLRAQAQQKLLLSGQLGLSSGKQDTWLDVRVHRESRVLLPTTLKKTSSFPSGPTGRGRGGRSPGTTIRGSGVGAVPGKRAGSVPGAMVGPSVLVVVVVSAGEVAAVVDEVDVASVVVVVVEASLVAAGVVVAAAAVVVVTSSLTRFWQALDTRVIQRITRRIRKT